MSDTGLCQVLKPTAAVDDHSFFFAYLTSVNLSLPCQWSMLLDCLKNGDKFSSSFLSLFELLSHAVPVETFCPLLFLILTECFSSFIFFTFFSVLIASNVLLLVSNWDIKVKTSELTASSPSFHLLESCILFPCLGCCLCHVLCPCYSNLFSALKLVVFVSGLTRPKK